MVPIIIPMNMGGGGGPIGLIDIFILLGIILVVIYLCQVAWIWLQLFLDGFKSKKLFLLLHIPIVPLIVICYKKFMSIGKED
jgi:hypothetical protein